MIVANGSFAGEVTQVLDTEDAIGTLRMRGLRVTPQRRAVLDALAGDTTHPLVEEVAARVARTTPGVSLSTVYKTLHEFAAIGLIRELETGGVLRFDAEPARHGHVVCPACGTVRDFELPSEVLQQVSLAAEVAEDDVHVVLEAACAACERESLH